jgi:hypothetical protein
MDWMWLVIGLMLGSLLTAVLIWSQRGTMQQAAPPGYFARVAQSAVITALLAGAGACASPIRRLTRPRPSSTRRAVRTLAPHPPRPMGTRPRRWTRRPAPRTPVAR